MRSVTGLLNAIPGVAVAAAVGLAAEPALNDGAYRIAPGDVLDLGVLGAPDLARKLTVLADGSVSLPFVGTVTVVGRTLAEATRALVEGRGARRVCVSVRFARPVELRRRRPVAAGVAGEEGWKPRRRCASCLAALG